MLIRNRLYGPNIFLRAGVQPFISVKPITKKETAKRKGHSLVAVGARTIRKLTTKCVMRHGLI